MTCPICDQKPMNCDCTPRERAMYREMQEREDAPTLVLTSEERCAIGRLIGSVRQRQRFRNTRSIFQNRRKACELAYGSG